MSRRFSFEISPGPLHWRYILCGTFRNEIVGAALRRLLQKRPLALPGALPFSACADEVSGLSSRPFDFAKEPAIVQPTRQPDYTVCPRSAPIFIQQLAA
jgi:hypothetical protein